MGKGTHGYERTNHASNSYRRDVLLPFMEEVQGDKYQGNGTRPILDVASGLGEVADFLERTYGRTLVRTDLSHIALTHGQGERVRSDMEHLPFQANSFAAVHCKDALVHVFDKKQFFSELYRVLTPGGKVLVASAAVAESTFFYASGTGGGVISLDSKDDYVEKSAYYEVFHDALSVSPPYYETKANKTRILASQAGFRGSSKMIWPPPKGEEDWYENPEERFVLILRKPH